jgi:hypothetical protein
MQDNEFSANVSRTFLYPSESRAGFQEVKISFKINRTADLWSVPALAVSVMVLFDVARSSIQ